MKALEALRMAAHQLEQAQVPKASLDAQLLLAELMQVERLHLLALQADLSIDADLLARYQGLLDRRARREPLQYILGKAWFMGHSFLIRPGVLIPRFDSETLAELAIARLLPGGAALDLCCGSGCLGISLKKAREDSRVFMGDLSKEAIALSQENAVHLSAHVDIRRGDLFAPFVGLQFDLILSNPPYIQRDELDGLQAEVGFEPRLALDGGPDGLSFYRKILEQAPAFLRPGGLLLLEMGDGQGGALLDLLHPQMGRPRLHRDLGGLPRVLELQRLV